VPEAETGPFRPTIGWLPIAQVLTAVNKTVQTVIECPDIGNGFKAEDRPERLHDIVTAAFEDYISITRLKVFYPVVKTEHTRSQ
jgi:hypothetical protein